MLKHLRLERVGPADTLEAELSERWNVFTGDNGLGKSFILDVAWWVLTRSWAGQPAMGRRQAIRAHAVGSRKGASRVDAPSIRWRLQGARGASVATVKPGTPLTEWTGSAALPKLVGVVLYARIDGGFSLWDPARNAYHFTREEVWDGKPIDAPGKICEGLIRDWRDWQSNESSSEFRLLTELLEVLSPEPSERMAPGGPPRMLDPDDARRIPMLRLPYGDVPLIHASAGMRRVLALAYLLVWSWEKHREASEALGIPPEQRMVLLINEVEAHLHPRWQRVIVPAILKAIEHVQPGVSVQVLMTTHSPMVLASLEPHFDPRLDQLFRFGLQDGNVELDPIDWAKHGDATGWLVSEIFELPEARSPEAEAAIARAQEFLRGSGEDSRRARKLEDELAALLPSLDPFWAAWRFGLQRMKLKVGAR